MSKKKRLVTDCEKMRVSNDAGNLLFDSSHPDCSIDVFHSQNENYAFITALDVDVNEPLPDDPMTKKYWGKFSWNDKENCIREILHTGGKWPVLPES